MERGELERAAPGDPALVGFVADEHDLVLGQVLQRGGRRQRAVLVVLEGVVRGGHRAPGELVDMRGPVRCIAPLTYDDEHADAIGK